MTDRTETIAYGFAASPHPHRKRAWLATFWGPGIGTRHVREADGRKRAYPCEESAGRAAMDAMILALNGKRRDPVSGRPMSVNRKARMMGGKLADAVFAPRARA